MEFEHFIFDLLAIHSFPVEVDDVVQDVLVGGGDSVQLMVLLDLVAEAKVGEYQIIIILYHDIIKVQISINHIS